LHTGEQTDLGVLPQLQALEPASADTAGVASKRGAGDGGRARSTTGVQHGRGETGRKAGVAPSGAAREGNPTTGVAVVFVVDKHHKPLQPTTERRARKLLKAGRAVVHRRYPFVIRVKDRTVGGSCVDGVQVGIDPGSRHTGIAVFTEKATSKGVVRTGLWLGELDHRGQRISRNLSSRAALRRGRRSRNLRYRKPRFLNRHPAPCDSCGANAQSGKRLCRPCQNLPRAERERGARPARLAPSLRHRVDTLASWANRLQRWAPVTGWHQELVRFDLHAMQRPGITSVEYQQGTLAGFEVREYLLSKWNHKCAYCGASGVGPGSVPLNIDHIHPGSKGGSNRISNLALACVACNQAKSNMPVEDFLVGKPAVLARVLAQAKAPLADAAAVNTTRWAVFHMLADTGLPVTAASGGRTKYNRTVTGTPKAHALDALCVGVLDRVKSYPSTTMVIGCAGRGTYARTRSDKHGFQRLHLTRTKRHYGFQTGDLVTAAVPTGAKAGIHIGTVAVRARGMFNITTAAGTIRDIHHRHVRLIQRADGYTYHSTSTPRVRLLSTANDRVPAGQKK